MSENGTVLARAVVVLEGDSKKLEEMMSESEKKMKKLGEGMKDLGEHLTTHLTLELVALGAEAVHAFGEQEDAMARTNAILRATGESAGVTSNHIHELAESLQAVTGFDSDVTTSASAMLLTFEQVQNRMGKGNDVFDRTVKVSQDLASLMGGDLQSAIRTMGVALEDPANGLTMLRREGIKFTAQQQEMIKNMYEHNNVLGAQKMILDVLQSKVGGLAKAMAKTPLGQFKTAWNSITDAMKPFGAIMMKAITPVLHGIEALAGWFKNLGEEAKTVIVIISAVVAAIGPLLVVIGTIMVAWTTLSVVLGAAMVPVLLVVAAIGLLILVGYELVKHWTWIELKAAEFWKFLKDMFYKGVDALVGAIQWYVQNVAAQFDLLKKLPGKLGELGAMIATPFDAAAEAIGRFREDLHAAQQVSDIMSDATIAKLTKRLKDQEAQAKKTGKAIHEVTPKAKDLPPVWLGPATAALNDLQTALETNASKAQLLGTQFDKTGADASAYAAAIDTLLKAHVPLDASLSNVFGSLQDISGALQDLQVKDVLNKMNLAMDDANKQAQALGAAFDLVSARSQAYDSAVQSLMALHIDLGKVLKDTEMTFDEFIKKAQAAKLEQIGKDLQDALAGAALQAQVLGANFDLAGAKVSAYEAAIQSAIAAHLQLNDIVPKTGMTLEELIKHLQKLKEASMIADTLKSKFVDLGDYLVDWAYGAKKSFGDFVRQALIDLTKLIVKMLILQELKSVFDPAKGGFLGSVGKVLGFADGGFIQSGTIGLVGERGPELISGGRNGVSITPMPAASASGASEAPINMKVDVHVNAIDQKGVADFFDNNEQMVAGAMLKAYQKSTVLRRRLMGA